jgi:nucleotide-binding universal stress UspA family protein
MKKILVPTDFSDCAEAAADFAIQLAKKSGAEICFMHLQATPADWVALSREKESMYPETVHAIGSAKSELSECIHKAEHQGVKAHRSLVYSSERGDILREQEAHGFDMIVMGSHGVKGLKKLIGSHALYMLRHASVPVLTVKHSVREPVKHMLFVSDFTDVSQESFTPLAQLADTLDAHIDLLYVNTAGEAEVPKEVTLNMERVASYGELKQGYTQNIVKANSVKEGVEQFARENTVDMIAICTHGHKGIKRLFSPSIAERLANHCELPLWSIRL